MDALPFTPKSVDIDLSSLSIEELDYVLSPHGGDMWESKGSRTTSFPGNTRSGARRMIQFDKLFDPITVKLGDSLMRPTGPLLEGRKKAGGSSRFRRQPKVGGRQEALLPRTGGSFAIHEDGAVPLRAVNGLGCKALRERTNTVAVA